MLLILMVQIENFIIKMTKLTEIQMVDAIGIVLQYMPEILVPH